MPQTYAQGTGGTVAPTGGVGPALGPEVTTSDSTTGPRKKKGKKRRVNGVVQYQWPNGTWHSRPYGKKFRHDGGGSGGSSGSGGGGGGGGNTGLVPTPKPSNHPLLDQANALANIRYGGAEQSLNARGQAIPAWYQNYINQVGGAQTQAQQYAAPIEAQAQQRATDAGQVAPGLDPNTPAGHDAALAAAARNALGQAFVTTLQGIGQVQNNYLAGRKAVAATSELGAQQQLASDRTAEKKERGAYVTSTLGDLRDKRRQQKLENQAFGLKETTAADSAADKAAQLNKYGYTDSEWSSFTDAKRNRIRNKASSSSSSGGDLGKVNKYGYTEKQWRGFTVAKRQSIMKKFDTTGSSGPAQFTPAARHKTKATIRKGMALIKSEFSNPHYTPEKFWDRSYKALVNNKGYDPLLARAIVQRMKYGHVNAKMAKRLKANYGITLGSGKAFKLPNAPGSIPVVGGIIGIGTGN